MFRHDMGKPACVGGGLSARSDVLRPEPAAIPEVASSAPRSWLGTHVSSGLASGMSSSWESPVCPSSAFRNENLSTRVNEEPATRGQWRALVCPLGGVAPGTTKNFTERNRFQQKSPRLEAAGAGSSVWAPMIGLRVFSRVGSVKMDGDERRQLVRDFLAGQNGIDCGPLNACLKCFKASWSGYEPHAKAMTNRVQENR